MSANDWIVLSGLVIGLFGQWGLISYYAGRTSKAIEGLVTRVDGHSAWIKEVNNKVNELDKDVARIKERIGR